MYRPTNTSKCLSELYEAHEFYSTAPSLSLSPECNINKFSFMMHSAIVTYIATTTSDCGKKWPELYFCAFRIKLSDIESEHGYSTKPKPIKELKRKFITVAFSG